MLLDEVGEGSDPPVLDDEDVDGVDLAAVAERDPDLRGGTIARTNAVVIKMSKPHQDVRFDIPVIGPRTIRAMIRCKARCLAIEAGKTLIIDREQCVRLADKARICIVAA